MLSSSLDSMLSSTSPLPKTKAFTGPNFSLITISDKNDASKLSTISFPNLQKYNLFSFINAVVNVACVTFSNTSL